jgi:hypothetical protein
MNEIQETALMLNLHEQQQLIRQQQEQMRQIQELQLLESRDRSQQHFHHQRVAKVSDDDSETSVRVPVTVEVKHEALQSNVTASGCHDTIKGELGLDTQAVSASGKKRSVHDDAFAPNTRQKQSDHNTIRDGE